MRDHRATAATLSPVDVRRDERYARAVLASRALALVGLLGACAIGAPPGFSSGTSWTFPLVDPLADGKLYTPVMIAGKGPYLFAIDPSIRTTIVDREIYERGAIPVHPAVQGGDDSFGVAFQDKRSKRTALRLEGEDGVTHITWAAPLLDVEIGNLAISQLRALTWGTRMFDAEGRRVYGILGRDVIADSLVFTIDRDRGIASLQTQEVFKPTAGAKQLRYERIINETTVDDARVAADVNGKRLSLALDFGRVASELREAHWTEATLEPVAAKLTVIDDIGTHRSATVVGIAPSVAVAGIERQHVDFVTYADQRRYQDLDLAGTLGLDFFRPFAVVADWQHTVLYLTPRAESAEAMALRLGRWGTAMPACASAGCATVAIVGDATAPALQVTRDPAAIGRPLEVVVSATAPSGEALPTLRINLMPEAPDLVTPAEARYAGAKLEVIDASPFPLGCDAPAHCVIAQESPLP